MTEKVKVRNVSSRDILLNGRKLRKGRARTEPKNDSVKNKILNGFLEVVEEKATTKKTNENKKSKTKSKGEE